METSVLKTLKKPLNISADDDSFDQDLILFINAELHTLRQLGLGGTEQMIVNDDTTTWSDILGVEDEKAQAAKHYIFLSVKIIFDPPQSVPALNALKDSRQETGWRITES